MLMGDRINLVSPTLDDWINVKGIWEDEETMADVGGAAPLPLKRYRAWWSDIFERRKAENAYFLILDKDNAECFGESGFHGFNRETGRAVLNVKVKSGHRNRGIGSEALALILRHFFEDWGGGALESVVRMTNAAGRRRLLEAGFTDYLVLDEWAMLEMREAGWKRSRRPE